MNKKFASILAVTLLCISSGITWFCCNQLHPYIEPIVGVIGADCDFVDWNLKAEDYASINKCLQNSFPSKIIIVFPCKKYYVGYIVCSRQYLPFEECIRDVPSIICFIQKELRKLEIQLSSINGDNKRD
jgi:hypothetical protein